MGLHNTVFSRFATLDTENDEVSIDFNGLVSKLLLFDQYIIDSIRLKDVPQLIHNFGVKGLIELLESSAVLIHCDALTTAETGQATVLKSREIKGALPLCSYDFVNINTANREEYISTNLQNVHNYVNNTKDAIRLKRAILDALVDTPVSVPAETIQGMTKALLEKKTLLRQAIINTTGVSAISAAEIEIDVTQLDTTEFKAESNLRQLLNVSKDEEHKILQRSMLDISGLYQRLSYMKNFEASAGFHEKDMQMLNEELSFAALLLNSQKQEDSLTRILRIKALPRFSYGAEINVKTLLRLRDSDECRIFREWLKGTQDWTAEEMINEMNSASVKISELLGGNTFAFVKIAVSTGLGLVLQNPLLSAGSDLSLNALDEFVLKKIVKSKTAISFINNSLPRLYEPPIHLS